jgi:uncharacterized protein (DUF952 family)
MRLFHITSEREAREAAESGEYIPAPFVREGFIHCSYAAQVVATANRIFRGRQDLVLMEIDPSLLECRVVDENLEGGTELFPHIYGRLNMAAVKKIHALPCDEAGSFSASAGLSDAAGIPLHCDGQNAC